MAKKIAQYTRDDALKMVYRTMHRDFKGSIDGVKTVMVYRQGTCLITLDQMTDKEIYDRLPKEVRDLYYPHGVE